MPRLRVVLVLALLAAAPLLAGCVAPILSAEAAPGAPAAVAATWYEAALAHGPGHDHHDLAQHQGASTPNFRLVGRDPLLTERHGGAPAGMYGCGDSATRADGRRLTVVAAFLDEMAFVLVDVTDPESPAKVGEFHARGMGSWDAAITRDGRHVVLAMTSLARRPGVLDTLTGEEAPSVWFTGACGTRRLTPPDLAVTAGIVLVDVTDPARPAYADYDPTPAFNMHSVATGADGSAQYVIGSVVNLQHSASYFVFDQVVDTPLGARLARLSTFAPPPAAVTPDGRVAVPGANGHTDGVLQRHPVDGRLYAYLAAWNGGVLVLDVTVPAAPLHVATWTPPGADALGQQAELFSGSCYPDAIHTVLPVEGLWEGRHYLFAGQECVLKTETDAPGGSVFVLDTTDPWRPTLVGSWHLPLDTGVWTVPYQASPHYVALHGRTLFVSDYHAGLWAVDVGPGKLARPPSVGVYLPDLAPPVPPARGGTPTPYDEQVDVYPDGTIVLNEGSSGLYVLRFDAASPAPPAMPWDYG